MEDEGEDLGRETEDLRRKTRDAKRHHSSLVFRLKSCLGLSSCVSCLKSYPLPSYPLSSHLRVPSQLG